MEISTNNIPKPIQQYLNMYPLFAVPYDIAQLFIRTSPESFFYAVKLVLKSLEPHATIWSTDNLNLSSSNFFSNYWFEGGLEYLQANYEAASRGVQLNRVFVVREKEYEKYKIDLDLIAALHARAGVRTYLAIYESLPSNCRYDFAVYGDYFVDEVIYDIGGNIIDNFIHWSDHQLQQFKWRMDRVRNHIKMQLALNIQCETDFCGVVNFAQRVKQTIQPALEQPHRGLNPMRRTGNQPIKILLLAANSLDTTHLRLDQEFRDIDRAVRQSEFRDGFHIEQQHAVRVADLQGHLLRYQPDIVHFSGHGSNTDAIILEDSSGGCHPVSSRALKRLFAVLHDNVKCIILNACYSETQARAIAEHIDCVIGMSRVIGDAAAINFAVAFYQALGYGRDIFTAYELGCVQIDLQNLDEQDTPILISPNSDPKQIKFVGR